MITPKNVFFISIKNLISFKNTFKVVFLTINEFYMTQFITFKYFTQSQIYKVWASELKS